MLSLSLSLSLESSLFLEASIGKCFCSMDSWLVIPFATRYEASTGGLVRHARSGRLLRPYLNPQRGGRPPYLRISLFNPEGRGRREHHYLNRLIKMTFDPCLFMDEMEVHHLNGDRFDNRLLNLAWAMPQHAPYGWHTTGTGRERNPRAKVRARTADPDDWPWTYADFEEGCAIQIYEPSNYEPVEAPF